MTGRDYLGRLLDYQKAIDRLDDRTGRMRDSKLVSNLSGMPGAPYRDNQAQEKRMVDYAEYNKQLKEMKCELETMKVEAIGKLAMLSKESYEQVLYYRYIDMKSWPEVAEIMDDMSTDNAYKLHRKALKELTAILAEDPYIS